MGRITRFSQLCDEHHELAAYITIALAAGGRAFDRLGDWPAVALVALGLLTLLGSAYYRGVRIGPSGFSVGDDDRQAP